MSALSSLIPFAPTTPLNMNYVGMLHETIQKLPRGVDIQESYTSVGPDHIKSWSCTLSLTSDGKTAVFEGKGANKKVAKNAAAREACIALGIIEACESLIFLRMLSSN